MFEFWFLVKVCYFFCKFFCSENIVYLGYDKSGIFSGFNGFCYFV